MEKINSHVWSGHLFVLFDPAAGWWEICSTCMNPLCNEYRTQEAGFFNFNSTTDTCIKFTGECGLIIP